MRVLQVAARASTLAQFGLPLMEKLREAGFDLEVLTGLDGAESRIEAQDFPIHPWRMGHTLNPIRLWSARAALRGFLRDHSYDIAHVHGSFAGILGNDTIAPHVGALIYTQHGFYVHQGLDPLRRRLWLGIEARGLRHASHLVCVSRAERDIAGGLDIGADTRFLTIPGAGVRTDEFRLAPEEHSRRREALRQSLGINQDETVLLTVARLTWDKGYRELIEAIKRLRGMGREFRLLAAGSGKDERAIDRAVHQAGLGDTITLLGWRDDVMDLYCAADVFVFASHREGLPIAPIEAMASGLPVVASDLPGCREELEEGPSGLLFETGSAGALMEQLERVLADRELAAGLAERARERAREFDLERVLALQLQLYREIAEAL